MTLPSIDAWHEVGEFELEDRPGNTTVVPVSVALDPAGGWLVKVAEYEAGIERLESPEQLVDYFANYGAPYLIDLYKGLLGIPGFEAVCELTERRLSASR